jgi:hypothetical protein
VHFLTIFLRLPGSRAFVRAVAWSALLFLVPGCAYQLGPTNQQTAGAQTIDIEYFPNQTIEPGLTDLVANAVRKQVQRDGTYRLTSRGNADIVVTGQIMSYVRVPVGSRRTDVLTPTDYDIRITVHAKAMRGGQTVYDGEVSGSALVAYATNLSNSERENAPVAAENLARDLVSRIANGSW